MILIMVFFEIIIDTMISKRRQTVKSIELSDITFWTIILIKLLMFKALKPHWKFYKIRVMAILLNTNFLILLILNFSYLTGIILVSIISTIVLQMTYVGWKRNYVYSSLQLLLLYGYVISKCPVFKSQISRRMLKLISG